MPERPSAQFWESWIWASPGSGSGITWCAGLPLLARAVVTYLLFPPPTGRCAVLPSVGQVASRTIVAPFGFRCGSLPRRSRGKASAARSRRSRCTASAPPRTTPRSPPPAAFFAELERASRRRAPSCRPRGGRHPGAAGPRRDRAISPIHAAAALQEMVTHFLAEGLSRGVADAGVDPGRAEPDSHPAPRRNGVSAAARLDPDLRRPDGAGRGGRHRHRRPGGTAHAPPAGGRVLSADDRARSVRSPPRGGSSSAAAWIPVKYCVRRGRVHRPPRASR